MKPYNSAELIIYRHKLRWERKTYLKHKRYFIFKNEAKFFIQYITRINNISRIIELRKKI